MKRLPATAFSILLALGLLLAFSGAEAKPKAAQQVQKERLVLMPLRLDEADQKLQGAMEMALVKGLQQKYEVFFGEQVAKKAREIFLKESRNTAKKECDETRCLQGIAEAFQAELLATANITKQDGGYFIALSVQNLFDNKVVQSESIACEGCNAFKVVEKLKELVGTPAPVATAPADEEVPAKVNLSDPETALWEEAKKGNSAEDYQAYLSTYPKGKYAPLAKTKLARIKDEAKAETEKQEQQAWSDAQQSASQESYSAYLSVYPKGRFAALAQARINKLQKEEADAEAKQRREQLAEEARQKREAAEAAKNAGQGPVMVTIPGGSFQIGASTEIKNPIRTVSIRSFEMGKYHVTRGEFAKFVSETGYDAGSSCYVWDGSKWDKRSGSNWRNPGFAQDDGHPVTCVNWNDAQAYAAWLSKKTGRQYRLPNEEEWEVACYGGSKVEYCGSSNIDSVAWYNANSNSTTHPVGEKQANGYGLYDMSGNLRQWMKNLYDGPAYGRSLRGGSWFNSPQDVRAALRDNSEPTFRYSLFGFRLARTLP